MLAEMGGLIPGYIRGVDGENGGKRITKIIEVFPK